jgi:hypothetical protein
MRIDGLSKPQLNHRRRQYGSLVDRYFLAHPDCAAELGDLQRRAERGAWLVHVFLRSWVCTVIRMIGA